jgi:hypothetical protein
MTQHYIEIVTWNKKMILMYGDKLTKTQKAIGLRSNGLHTEIRYSGRYGHICFSCTLADGVGGCRFMMHGFSHPYRQSRVRIPVTAEQEARLFAKACEMADMDGDAETRMFIDVAHGDAEFFKVPFYGHNHIKYDKNGARFAFILKWEWWKMHRVKMICNEACANVLLTEWPDLLDIKKEDGTVTFSVEIGGDGIAKDGGRVYPKADPATLTPDQFEYMVSHYFYQEMTDETA